MLNPDPKFESPLDGFPATAQIRQPDGTVIRVDFSLGPQEPPTHARLKFGAFKEAVAGTLEEAARNLPVDMLRDLAPGQWTMKRPSTWTIPLWIGYGMYRNNLGLRWERTLKKDDNRLLVRDRVARGNLGYVEVKRLEHRIAAE